MLKELLAAGLKADADRHAAEEATKLGRLRGGTSGCIGPDGQAYGACPRVAYLRSLGVSSEADTASRELFEAGYASEAALLKRLADGLPPGKRLATAEELDFAWTTPDGTVVSGRPDGGVVGPAGLEFGVELKLAASLWTVIGVTYDRRPKSDHLVQAAHYSWRLGGVPFGLVYSVRSDYHLSTAPRWLTSKFTAESPHIQLKDGKPFKIRPHTTTYDLTWVGGVWQYWTEGMDRPCPTAITAAGIEGWYASVARIGKGSDVLPARPGTSGVDGAETYNPCQYCDFAPQCDQHEDKGVQAWTDHVRTAYLTKES